LVSGIFIFIESLELPSFVNSSIGISLFIFAIFIIFSRLIYFRIKTYRIETVIEKAESYQFKGEHEESLELLNELLEDKRNLKIKEIWNNKAITLYYLARYEVALESFNYALEIDPFYKFGIYGKGTTLPKLKRFEEALESYDKTLAIDPTYKDAWYNKACIESLQNNKDKALEHLKKAINLDDKYKESAKADSDFNNIRDSQEFKELIEG